MDETIPVLPASTHREVGPRAGGSVWALGAVLTALQGVAFRPAPQSGTLRTIRPSRGPRWVTGARALKNGPS